MTFKVCEDILYQKRLEFRRLEGRQSLAVVYLLEQRGGRRKQSVEYSSLRIVDGFEIGYAAIMIDLQIGHVTARASHLGELRSSSRGLVCLLIKGGLEIVQQIKLKIIHHRPSHLVAGWTPGRDYSTVR